MSDVSERQAPVLDVGSAAAVAAEFADEVDRDARFPQEAVAALRSAKLLSASLPTAAGGGGASITQLARVARALGAACSSTGMIFAMHHSQALCLARHAPGLDFTAEVARQEWLLASATTEITTGGDLSRSGCAVEDAGSGRVTVTKQAPVISYGAYADAIMVTARRAPDAPPNDQVLLAVPAADVQLEATGVWDTLGFRGTCSPGYVLRGTTAAAQVLPVPFNDISAATMLPTSHTLWSSVWLGIADAAVAKARAETRKAVRRAGDTSPAAVPQTSRLADLVAKHQRFDSFVSSGVDRFADLIASGNPPTLKFELAMNNLKINASLAVVEVVSDAFAICGINGYRNDHASSMGRLLRDSFAPQVMVSNDRIRANNAHIVLAYRENQ